MDRLPLELVDRVASFLDLKDRCILSSVNSQYRSLLVPSLFECRTFTRSETDSEIDSFVEKYGRYVKILQYELSLYPDYDDPYPDDDSRTPQDINTVSQAALDILSGERLPNAKTLRIIFLPYKDFDSFGFDNNELGGSIYICQDPESREDIKQAEEEFSWRAVMKQSMEALVRNGSIRHLELRNLPPLATSVYLSEAWQQWVGRLESFDVQLWGSDNGAGWQTNTTEGYPDFVVRMKDYFFDHLSSAKRLRFCAHELSVIGCEGHHHCPLPFGSTSAPQVQEIELENCIIDPALSSFLEGLSHHLRSLRLIECYSGADAWRAENPISWAQLFTALERSNPSLSDFNIINDPTKFDYIYDSSQGVEASLRRFPYVSVDDKYGSTFPAEGVDADHYNRGDDERSYSSLMKIVQGNQGRERPLVEQS